MNESDHTLLFTKLHRPPIPRDFVPRPHLLDRLNDGLDGYITVVSAFAGSGKSTLISSWIEKISNPENNKGRHIPSIWISLDENDNDLILLLRYIFAGLRNEFPEVGSRTLELAQASPLPPPDMIVQTLSNEIDSIQTDFVVVLDDFSVLNGQAINRYLNDMLLHWPMHLHLVLLTRTRPRLPYSKLRSQGKINELYDADLDFSLAETTTYLNKTLPFNLSEEDIGKLEEETEGWIAGLQMASLSLKYSDDPVKFIDDLSGRNEKIYDYLIDEVLSKQPLVIRKFLLKTSILSRFKIDLCQDLFRNSDPDVNVNNSLDWLKRNNLFVIPLDYNQEWYRYHHLFQDSLQSRLSNFLLPKDISILHINASEWYARHGFIEDAINHAVQSGNQEVTVKLVEEEICSILNQEDRPTLERWLNYFTDDNLNARPAIMMLKIWVTFFTSQVYGTFAILHQMESELFSNKDVESLSEDLKIIYGQLTGIFCQEEYFNNQHFRAIEFAQNGLEFLPEKWSFVRGRLKMYLGLAQQAIGKGEEAIMYLCQEYDNLQDKSDIQAEYLLIAIGMIHFQRNELLEATKYFQTVIRQTSSTKHAVSHYWACLLLAQACYLLNNLDLAKCNLEEVIFHSYSVHFTTYHQALTTLALIYAIQADRNQADKYLQQISEFDLEKFGEEAPDVQSLRARFWLMNKDTDKAFKWIDHFKYPVLDKPLPWCEIPHITKVRLLVERNNPGDLEIAIQLLDFLEEKAERTHDTRNLIAILVTRSLVIDAMGNRDIAEEILAKALTLSKGSGNIRAFADNGPRMLEMLSKMAEEGREVQAIQPIIKSILQNGNGGRNKGFADLGGDYPVLRHPQLAESLTKREYDILVLLRRRMTNKEIADKLKLSPMTVKRHVTNLLSKLGVHKRWDAATRAVELGILPE